MRCPKSQFYELTYEDVFETRELSSVSVESLSGDGRHIKRHLLRAEATSPVKRMRKAKEAAAAYQMEDVEFGAAFEMALATADYAQLELVEDSTKIQAYEGAGKRRRYFTSDEPLREWEPLRDEYLAEFMQREGRGDGDTGLCYVCQKGTPLYRCLECCTTDMVCEGCCRAAHMERPLDIVEKWNGTFFERVSLKSLGVVVQLGHRPGDLCPHPRTLDNFTVIHTNGVHDVKLSYCNCPNRLKAGAEYRQQLLRRAWFPATHVDPRSCATFTVLNTFHIMTLQGKVTTYDFYAGIEKLTNNAGIGRIKDRYKEFARMIREWRHLKMLKRGGRGNDGIRCVAETRMGELGVECPACPRPGVNLPENWRNVKPENRFLYWLYLATDACFRLKRRLVSSEKRDPGLGTGWSYFVEDEPYREYVKNVGDQQEICTCTGLGALEQANTKYSRGYATTGVGLGCCARHEMVQKNGVVDLQKGERYVNMDYGYASLLRHHDPQLTKVTSYDIACQWGKNLIERVKNLPSLIKLDLSLQSLFLVVPKLHIHGHTMFCQLNFSLNWLWGAGRTDGEGIERGWAHMGPIATSTRDMGPGSRHDTMDDHFGHWNWVKLVGLGALLGKRLLTALAQSKVHRGLLDDFTEKQGEVTKKWEKMIKEWEGERHLPQEQRVKPNPYEVPKSGLSENEVRLLIAQEEAKEEEAGRAPVHDVSASAFISQGLELEEQQRNLVQDIKLKKFETTAQKTGLVERRMKLRRAIGRFRSLQATYMPGALVVLEKRVADPEKPEHAEEIPLLLPSTLPPAVRVSGCCDGLAKLEERLRDAQLRNSLNQLRNHLHMKSRLLTYRTSNVAHQASVTQSQGLLKRNEAQIHKYTARYQDAWAAMRNLVGVEGMKWRKLEQSDVRLMDSGEDRAIGIARKKLGKWKWEALKEVQEVEVETNEVRRTLREVKSRTGEGTRQMSWIWMEGGTGEVVDKKILDEIIRVEWCKAYARARRWEEEVVLVKEEMRRTLVSLEWMARQWEGRSRYDGPLATTSGRDSQHAEGHQENPLCCQVT